MSAYYNEMEPYAAQWLRNLIDKGLIAKGEVDERSILDVAPADLRGFTQCHFFAGIGGWSFAARLAGWPDERPLWTGSAPCQPFSVAGQQKGQADERHLWPVFFGLIRACRPPVVMGEQVAAAVGKDWLDGVSSDLEGVGYACGSVVIPACAVDAPHRRDRLWFVADRDIGQPRAERGDDGEVRRFQEAQREPEHGAPVSGRGGREDGDVADASNDRAGRVAGSPAERGRHSVDAGVEGIRQGNGQTVSGGPVSRGEGTVADAGQVGRNGRTSPARCEAGANAGVETSGFVGNTNKSQLEGSWLPSGVYAENDNSYGGSAHNDVADNDGRQPGRGDDQAARHGHPAAAAGGADRGHWDTYEWAVGADGKARRVKSGIRLLAHGVPARVGKLRAYGNAIVPQVAAEIIGAYLDAAP